MAHEYTKKVRFGEVDHAQIVYYPRVLHYCHLAMEDFFETETGASYAVLVRDRRLGFPSVGLEASFRKPMRFGDEITLRVSIVELGRSSVKTRYRCRNQDGEDCAEVLGTTVCIDMDAFESRALPDDLRQLFERHAE